MEASDFGDEMEVRMEERSINQMVFGNKNTPIWSCSSGYQYKVDQSIYEELKIFKEHGRAEGRCKRMLL